MGYEHTNRKSGCHNVNDVTYFICMSIVLLFTEWTERWAKVTGRNKKNHGIWIICTEEDICKYRTFVRQIVGISKQVSDWLTLGSTFWSEICQFLQMAKGHFQCVTNIVPRTENVSNKIIHKAENIFHQWHANLEILVTKLFSKLCDRNMHLETRPDYQDIETTCVLYSFSSGVKDPCLQKHTKVTAPRTDSSCLILTWEIQGTS